MSRLLIIIEDRSQSKDVAMGQLRNPHPGEILKEEFLNEIGMSQNQLGHAIGVPSACPRDMELLNRRKPQPVLTADFFT